MDPVPLTRAGLDALVTELRGELHRYCARMAGSLIDGEDLVQEVLASAYAWVPAAPVIHNPRGWLFRVAHNRAIDHRRRYERSHVEPLADEPPAADGGLPLEDRELATVALSVFLRLTPLQRSCVILKDILDLSLVEIAELLAAQVPAIKAALHRGRASLRTLAAAARVAPPALDPDELRRLTHYIDRFNARDFAAVRAMLAGDVTLDLVDRVTLAGAVAVGEYYHRYEQLHDWHLRAGIVDARPAILVHGSAAASGDPDYVIWIGWQEGRIAKILDFRHARALTGDAEVSPLAEPG